MKLTAERIRDVLSYDPDTGILRWKIRLSNRVSAGDIAGSLAKKGYLTVRVDGTLYLAHRLAWLHYYGKWPSKQIDHRDRNKANNRIKNLRDVTGYVNQQNRLGAKGFTWSERRGHFVAQITAEGKHFYLGSFESSDAAATAYALAKSRFHGEAI